MWGWLAIGQSILTGIYIHTLLRMDSYEREPYSHLILAFVWGALPSIAISILLRSAIWNLDRSTLTGVIIEEVCKALALIALNWHLDKEIDSWVDAIVYGGMIGLGFGWGENLIYLWHYPELSTLLTRGVLLGAMHGVWSALIGLTFTTSVWFFPVGLCLHWLHNSLANNGHILATLLLYLQVLGVLVGIGLTAHRYERQLAYKYLRPLLSKEDFQYLLETRDEDIIQQAMDLTYDIMRGDSDGLDSLKENLNQYRHR